MVCNNNLLSVHYNTPISEIDKIITDIKNGNYRRPIMKTQTYLYEEKPPIFIRTKFDSKPVVRTCPNCLVSITTKIQSKLNCIALCCCLFLIYFIFHVIRKRNLCCYDIIYKCPGCETTLGICKFC